MIHRLALVALLIAAWLHSSPAFAQAKKKAPFDVEVLGKTRTTVRDDTSAPAFLVTLVEYAKRRPVIVPYREDAAFPGGFAAGGPGGGVGGAAGGGVRAPYQATVTALRRIQGVDAPKYYVHIVMSGSREIPEEDARKLVQFKKEFKAKALAAAEVVESARVTLNCHGLVLEFNLKTGECTTSAFQVPDGFFDALSDALNDIDKLRAAKPAFQAK